MELSGQTERQAVPDSPHTEGVLRKFTGALERARRALRGWDQKKPSGLTS